MSEREWRLYINDMLRFAEKVKSYSEGMDFSYFVRDELKYDAILRNLELIGEAATHVPTEIQNARTDIPWRQIIATRNRLIHAYLGIDNDTIWSIVHSDVPDLITKLRALVRQA
jgi:uncharacterized protein with HEPN domain